ncbi:reverse transcriptase [Mycena venus]|uniref:Reverse transcriptase n=1 Tax=Mycena venus TaxID=2733690 RepID=A0A8H6Z716_9AGAR|nr:reverse transcriptase [Mycena venus]
MDLDSFLGVLRDRLELRPVPIINSIEELNDAVDFLDEVLLVALETSTPRHRPSTKAKRWWKPLLTKLRIAMRNSRRRFQRTRIERARTEWLDARRAFYRAISQAKFEVWLTFLKELERIDVYKALKRLKERRSAVFPSIADPNSGGIALTHMDRGRVLGRAWFGEKAAELPMVPPTDASNTSPDVTPETRVDQSGSGDRGMRGGVRSEALPLGGLPPSADRQDPMPASIDTSEAPLDETDAPTLAETIVIDAERPLVPPSDLEIDQVIRTSSPWKAPDRYGIQMGHVQRGYPVLAPWIRAIYRASLALGVKPTPFKANVATPVHKAGKKDKTSPKAWRPVENYEHILAKPLERLVANRLSFDAESLGFLETLRSRTT